MKPSKRPTAPAFLFLGALTLSACSPSTGNTHFTHDTFTIPTTDTQTSTAQDTPTLRPASGEIALLIDDEAAIPADLLDDFTKLTGVTVTAHTFDPSDGNVTVDVFIGFDENALKAANKAHLLSDKAPEDATPRTQLHTIPAALMYGHDDVCLLIDRQWAAINGQKPPKNLAEAADKATLITTAPAGSDTALTFDDFAKTTLAANYLTWNNTITTGAALLKTWEEAAETSTVRLIDQPGTRPVPGRPQWAGHTPAPHASISDKAGQRPMRIAPLSLIGRAATNNAKESYFNVVSGTCAARPLYAAASSAVNNADGVQAFLEYLLSPRAQMILAKTGAILPLDEEHAVGTLFEQVKAN